MKYAIPLAVAAVILGVGTYVEGNKSDRWPAADSDKLARFTERVKTIPLSVGDWQGTDDRTEDDEQFQKEFKASNCTACISRTYTNGKGQKVNVYVVSGKGRHITIHTPDWCYVGAGYDKVEDPLQYRIPMGEQPTESDPEFLTCVFRKESPTMKHEIRIFWTFSDDGNWAGPRHPKNVFGGRRAMYKIYLITDINEAGTAAPEGNPTLDFAKDFIPIVNDVLFDKPDSAAAENPAT
ncbi:MAG: exosortase-associated EpsI family protein [Planctomycetales bacterium]|nr:exosortase-associated EpsI family protein [Planctomycetales bacterium]